jgi:hypothetical protein
MKMLSKRKLTLLVCALSATLNLACNKQQPPAPAASGKPVYAVTGNEGSLSGTISFNGAALAAKPFDTSSDAVCKANGAISSEEIVVNQGKLQNVFVYVKSGLPANVSFPPQAAEVTLDQKGCRYVPHVLGLHTGASLKLASADQTNHNIHPLPKNNREWNETIFPGSDPVTRKFTKSEVMIPVKCGLHAWMRAYIGVLDHPFFAVSDGAGQFTIKGLPPGEYEIEAWHETLKPQTLKLQVEPKVEAKAAFSFTAAGAATAHRASGLQLMPALVLP